MDFTTSNNPLLTRGFAVIAWRAAVSAVAGLLVSAFAAAALAVGTVGSVDRLALGHTISDSLAPMLSAIAGAGLVASTVVFVCLLINDVRRRAGPWLFAQRGLLVVPLRAIVGLIARIAVAGLAAIEVVARSSVVVEAIWLTRTVGKALGLVLVYVGGAGLCVLIYVGMILTGLYGVGQSTHMVVAILDDPPRPLAMGLRLGVAIAVMYAALGTLALCAWLAYRFTRFIRAAMQRAERAKMSIWPR
jgi:hypothetical protein